MGLRTMRRKLTLFVAVLALLFLGAADCKSEGPNRANNAVHTQNADPPRGGWKDFADVVRSITYACDLFRYNTDAQLVVPTTEGAATQATSRDGVPAEFVNLVGDYYRGGLAPNNPDSKTALTIRRKHITDWCSSNGV